MAQPKSDGCNLVGTLVAAASNSTTSGDITPGSLELGMAIGTVLASGATALTNAISLPSRAFNVVALVQLSSAPATLTLDVASGGSAPTFTGDRASSLTVTTVATPVFVGPIVTYEPSQSTVNIAGAAGGGFLSTTTVNNKVQLRIVPVFNATVQKLCLIASIVVGKKHESHSIKKAFEVQGPPVATGCNIDSTGSWMP
jgi:hypothetical protein